MCQKYFTLILCLSFLSAVYAQTNCVTCDGTTNDNCVTKPSTLTAATCSTNECYTQIANGVVSRGCTGALPSGTTCTAPNCVTCTANNCNTQQTICQSCNSDTCAQLSATNPLYNTVCTTVNAQCYVGVNGANTERRCAQSTDSCGEDSTTCRLCTGSNCNNFVFPVTTTTTSPPTTTTPAPTTTTPAPTTTTPAPTSTTPPPTATTTPSTATTTPPPTDSTPAPTIAPGTIQCIVCTSDTDKICLGSPASITGTNCPGNVCYQAWVDNVYNRGCLSTAQSTLSQLCSSNSEQCKTCTTNLCNSDIVNGSVTTHLTFGLIISAAFLACRSLI